MAPRCGNNGSAGDNCDNTTAIDYKLSDFVEQFHTRCLTNPCALCGTIHAGRIHGYVRRNYRDRERQENITITIPVIICRVARARGTQYTRRFLPEFLTPHSVIRLDYLLEAADLPEGDRTEDAVCELLGCIDPRTARYQMRRLTSAIRAVSLDLAWRIAATPELGDLPESKPVTPPKERLLMLFDAQLRAGERAGAMYSPPSLRQLLQAAMRKAPGTKPLNRASPLAQPP
jgi:hypothetical protein